ncbi:MAG: alpha/beta hydrolase [Bacteroidota bacterium]
MNSFFTDAQAQEAAADLYQKKLDELNIDHESFYIESSFGNTHIISTGKTDGPPLILLHGSNGCAPIAIEALKGLLDNFKVFAIDVPGQPNLSEAFRPSMKNDEYGKWMSEVLSKLDVNQAVLVGISFGGFVCMKSLAFDASRISKAFLIVPAGIVNGNPLTALRKVFLPMKLYKWKGNQRHIHKFLHALFSEKDEFAISFLAIIFQHFDMDFSPIPLIQKEEAQKIKTPIHLIAAEQDIFFPGKKMIKRVQALFPSLLSTLLLENSKHVPSQVSNEKILTLIKQSMD